MKTNFQIGDVVYMGELAQGWQGSIIYDYVGKIGIIVSSGKKVFVNTGAITWNVAFGKNVVRCYEIHLRHL